MTKEMRCPVTAHGFMNSWKGYLLVGAGTFLVFLLLYVPADLFYRVLQKRGPQQQVVLHGLEGTWLSGSAASGRIQQLSVSNFSWKLRPSLRSLVQARVSFNLEGQGNVRGRLTAGFGGRLALTDLEADLPLHLLRQILSHYRLDLEGNATLRFSKIKLHGGVPLEAEGTLVFSQLGISQPMKLLLGDFKGEVTTSNDGIKLALTDTGGPLSANGLLLLKPDGSYSFTGDFAPLGQNQTELTTALRLLGPPGRDGRVKVAYSGSLKSEE
jgi:hypothetical protein